MLCAVVRRSVFYMDRSVKKCVTKSVRHVRSDLHQTDDFQRSRCSSEHLPARFHPPIILILRRAVNSTRVVAFLCPILIGSDINIHVDDDGDADARHLHEFQHNTTHRYGYSLLQPHTRCCDDVRRMQARQRKCRPAWRSV